MVMRYVFDQPSSWAHQTTTTLCVIAFGFGGAYCMARSEHISITSFADKVGIVTRRRFELVGLFTGLLYLAGLGWGLWLQAYQSIWRFNSGSWTPEEMPSPPHWPLPAVMKAALLASTILFLAVVLERLISVWRRNQVES